MGAVVRALREDLGDISPGQALILDRIKEKLIVLMQIGAYVDRQPSIISADGELIACLGRNYTGYAEAVRRDVLAVYEMASKKPTRVPDLREYIDRKGEP